ncbi:MAG TPA: hydantoinase/oxoprolinase family protein, partial [Planctomycetaceae bacterium]|nr:hydantoinase/oxoprolinase family protein [Planctomycetaceae bacterium]
GDREVRVWCTSGEFLDPAFACEFPLLVAAANWHALASWAGQLVPDESALLVDIGTTTTDIIPLEHGLPVSRGLTDLERLQHRELEYSGVARTPLFALAHSVPFRGGECPLAAEVFATTLDLYLWSGRIPTDPQNRETANGQPATRDASRDRLCRMLCADSQEISDDELDRICVFLEQVHLTRLKDALSHVAGQLPGTCETVILSGRGAFLAAQALREVPQLTAARTIPIEEMFDPQVAEAACAFAVARLAEDR